MQAEPNSRVHKQGFRSGKCDRFIVPVQPNFEHVAKRESGHKTMNSKTHMDHVLAFRNTPQPTSAAVAVAFAFFFLPSQSVAADLEAALSDICVQEDTTPVNYTLTAAESRQYCDCEARIWTKSGSETQLRSVMTYITGNRKHMNGRPYVSDDALDFIVEHSGTVKAQCESLFD